VKGHLFFLASLASAGVIAAGGTPALAAGSVPAAAGTITGSWGTAQAVPGLTANGEIDVNSVSCSHGGVCYAVGNNVGTSNPADQSFIVTDSGGTWSKPTGIPGFQTSLVDSQAGEEISCPAAGDCLVTGEYYTSSHTGDGFTIEEVKGVWRKLEAIPGLAALGPLGATITNATCAAPGYCTVSGTYETGTESGTGVGMSSFVADEVNYTWGKAAQIPNLATLNAGDFALSSSLVCPSPKNCTLEGLYSPAPASSSAIRTLRADLGRRVGVARRGVLASLLPRLTGQQALAALRSRPLASPESAGLRVFVDSEVNGRWQKLSAPAFPGITSTGTALVTSNVACTSAGNCVAPGVYTVRSTSTYYTGYLLTESGGRWSLTTTNPAQVIIYALACPSPGNCVAGGVNNKDIAVTLHQAGGTWTAPAELPGATGLAFNGTKAQQSEVDYLACPTAGNCTAVGRYVWVTNIFLRPSESAFVASEAGGRWSAASNPAGLVTLNSGAYAYFGGLSCASVATCAAVGGYTTSAQANGAFLLSEIPARATSASIGLSRSSVGYGKEQSEKISVMVSASGATPGGTASVLSGTHVVCTVTLKSGKGSCTLTARKLAKGTYHLVASYPGSFGFAASASKSATLKVTS
jgi:hypothetical protein